MAENPYLVSEDTLAKLGNGDTSAGRRVLRAMIDLECGHDIEHGNTEKPPHVRAAVEADEDAIVALLKVDLLENARLVNTIDDQRITSFVQTATKDHIATIGVIDGSDGIIAAIFIEPELYWWTTMWSLAERVTFVHPDYRNSNYAVDLLKFAKWFADSMTARLGYTVYLTATIAAPRDAYRKSALYGRFMHFMGGTYCYPRLPSLHVQRQFDYSTSSGTPSDGAET